MRKGFTLVEVVIVMAIVAIVTGPILAVVVSMYRQFQSVAMMAGLRDESDIAASSVMRLAAAGGAWHLDRDNHGVQFANGKAARWAHGHLRLRDHGRWILRPLPEVNDMTMVRHGQTLSVTVYVSGPARVGGPPVASHQTYDWEGSR